LRINVSASSPSSGKAFLPCAVLFAIIYWLCFAKDEPVPNGDVRLFVNIGEQHHIKRMVEADKQDTTIGEIIEQLIDKSF